MKCPKCGYVSFDHNDSCPKCNRNLSSERERLNLTPFPPDPPFLLAALLGDVNESGMHYHSAGSGAFRSLEEEIEFEAETEEMALASNESEEETEIEIALDSSGKDEIAAPELEYLDTAEAETLPSGPETQDTEEISTGVSELDDLLELELQTPSPEQGQVEAEERPEEPEPLVFEMEDITLEEPSPLEELDLELDKGEDSEAPTEAFDTAVDSLEFISQEEAAGPTLSLEELKDDELGEVDVSLDEVAEPTTKIVDSHGG